MVEHAPLREPDLRLREAIDVTEQERRLRELTAEWADLVAKRQVEETDRLAAEAFG